MKHFEQAYSFCQETAIHMQRHEQFFQEIPIEEYIPRPITIPKHLIGNPEKIMDWLLISQAISFSLWPTLSNTNVMFPDHWQIQLSGNIVDPILPENGIRELISYVLEIGIPLHDGNTLKNITSNDIGIYFQPTPGYPSLLELELRFSCLREVGHMIFNEGNCIGLIERSNFMSHQFLEGLLYHCKSWNDQVIIEDIPLSFQWRGWKLCHFLQQALFDYPSRQFVDSEHFAFYADPRYSRLFFDTGLLICNQPYDLLAGSRMEIEIRICTQNIIEQGYKIIKERHPNISRMHFQKYLEDLLLFKEIRPLYSSKTLCY
tara:strand:- start:367 stop:1317 length:951 start_codon:yes stop_codon:yes gene_type:complete